MGTYKPGDVEAALQALEQAGGNKTAAAKSLGLSRASFRRRLEKASQIPAGADWQEVVGSQRVEILRLRKELRDVRQNRAVSKDFEDLVQRSFAAPRHIPEWVVKPGVSSSKNVASAILSDIHYGEVVNPEEIMYLNAYNVAIADARLYRFFEGAARIMTEILPTLNLEGIVLFFGGDMFSGDIHDELRETNEITSYEALLRLSEKLSAGIRMLADSVGKVHVVGVPGNHPRTTRKPHAKKYAATNLDWVLYQLVRRDFEGSNRVTFQLGMGVDIDVDILGWRYRLTHGDQARGGNAMSGPVGPLMLLDLKKLKIAQRGRLPIYDYAVMGHFHQFIPNFQGVIVNGSIVGYNEYSFRGNFSVQPPQQGFWVTHPTRGVTYSTPIFVGHEDEGWQRKADTQRDVLWKAS